MILDFFYINVSIDFQDKKKYPISNWFGKPGFNSCNFLLSLFFRSNRRPIFAKRCYFFRSDFI